VKRWKTGFMTSSSVWWQIAIQKNLKAGEFRC
jgi:hypothetical protein